jgi:hypothetical protein
MSGALAYDRSLDYTDRARRIVDWFGVYDGIIKDDEFEYERLQRIGL